MKKLPIQTEGRLDRFVVASFIFHRTTIIGRWLCAFSCDVAYEELPFMRLAFPSGKLRLSLNNSVILCSLG